MQKNLKKILKIIGNIVTVIAVLFIIKKLVDSDIDYSSLFQKKNILPVTTIIIVQAIIVVTNTYPWKKLVQLLSRKTITFQESIPVYVKSNLLKYVPGNVFQYVGRNELAVNKQIPHLQVATATIIDIGMTVFSSFVISLVFLSDYMFSFVKKNPHLFNWIFLTVILLIAIIFILGIVFRKKLSSKFENYRYLLHRKSLFVLLKCLIYYIIVMMISSFMYMITVVYILNVNVGTELWLQLFSAYTLSWLVGFITPGAPAGIGIKEAVMVGVTGNLINVSTITLSMVILRILTTLSDILAFLCVQLWKYILKKKRHK